MEGPERILSNTTTSSGASLLLLASSEPNAEFDAGLSICTNSAIQMIENNEDRKLKMNLQAMKKAIKDIEQKANSKFGPATANFMDHTDLWVNEILPFLGMGNYALVAPVNKKMKELYTTYCDGVENPPLVVKKSNKQWWGSNENRHATRCDTFYSAAFVNVDCAQLWWQSLPNHVISPEWSKPVIHQELVRAGNIAVIQWAGKHGFQQNESMCEDAAIYGHIEVLKFLCQNGPFPPSTINAAARGGSLETVQWLHAQGCPWDEGTCTTAAAFGHLHVLQWLHANGCPWEEETFSIAGERGHLEVLEWGHENGGPLMGPDICARAACCGHLHVLKWAHENGFVLDANDIYDCALEVGHFDVMKYVHEQGSPLPANFTSDAAYFGKLDWVNYGHAHGCPWDEYTCACAASGGHLELLQYLRLHGCEWDEKTCSWAAYHGNLQVLEWAHENGCPWNEETCKKAAANGQLDLLKYARGHGCPWDGETVKMALKCRQMDVLKWALDNGCPYQDLAQN